MRASFVALLRGHCLSAKSLLGFDFTCAGVHQKRLNIKSVITIAVTMTSCFTATMAATKHTANLSLQASRFLHAFLQENFTSKWWLSSKVEAWNFTKNKLLKLNENRLFCRLKSELNYSEKCPFHG